MKHVALYARVSTKKQSLDPQIAELQDCATRMGWASTTLYTDIRSSAKPRPGLRKLMAAVESDEVELIVVVRIDRLGRIAQQVREITKTLQDHSVGLVLASEPARKLDAFGILLTALIAQYERDCISCNVRGIPITLPTTQIVSGLNNLVTHANAAIREHQRARTKAGLRSARSKGVRLGRKPLDPALASKAAKLKAEGKTVRQIAAELKISVGAVSKILRAQPEENPSAGH